MSDQTPLNYRIKLQDIGSLELELYLSWISNPQVNRFLEVRHENHDIESLGKWIADHAKSKENLLFAIETEESGKPIGTIRISRINRMYGTCDLGLMIGNTEYWGKGYGFEAIRVACDFMKEIGIRKVHAGAYHSNTASIKAFTKNGFSTEGRLIKQVRNELTDAFEDVVLMSKFL